MNSFNTGRSTRREDGRKIRNHTGPRDTGPEGLVREWKVPERTTKAGQSTEADGVYWGYKNKTPNLKKNLNVLQFVILWILLRFSLFTTPAVRDGLQCFGGIYFITPRLHIYLQPSRYYRLVYLQGLLATRPSPFLWGARKEIRGEGRPPSSHRKHYREHYLLFAQRNSRQSVRLFNQFGSFFQYPWDEISTYQSSCPVSDPER